MKPKLTTAAIVVALVFSGFLFSRSCGLTDAYKHMRSAYNELKAITETDKKMSDEKIQHMTNAIGQADKTIVTLQGVIREKAVQVSGLSRELAELRAAEPTTTPEIEAMPIVVSLRRQIRTLTNMYSLSQQTINLQSREIAALEGKCISLGAIGDEWKRQYDKEHALRIASEGLVTSLEKRVKAQGLLVKVKAVALGVTAGVLTYSIIKKK